MMRAVEFIALDLRPVSVNLQYFSSRDKLYDYREVHACQLRVTLY